MTKTTASSDDEDDDRPAPPPLFELTAEDARELVAWIASRPPAWHRLDEDERAAALTRRIMEQQQQRRRELESILDALDRAADMPEDDDLASRRENRLDRAAEGATLKRDD